MTHRSAQTAFLAILAAVAIFATLRVGQSLFAPILSALVLGVVCAPLADRIERIGVPRVLAALLVVTFFALFTSTIFLLLEPTISRAIQNAPSIWREMTAMLEAMRGAFEGVRELQDTVSGALSETPSSGVDPVDAPVTIPGVMDALALAPSFAAALLIFVGTFYFFLISRQTVYARINDGPIAIGMTTLTRAESRVSRYFLTITLINACFGALIGLVMALIGLPQPMLWGVAAFLVNFVLYLGPASLAVAFLVAGLISFDGPLSFAPPVIYVAMNMTEGQFVTPGLVGHRMRVNPLMIFISLVFWLWLWGPIGGVVAIPVLVWSLYILGKLDWEDPEDAQLQALHGNTMEG